MYLLQTAPVLFQFLIFNAQCPMPNPPCPMPNPPCPMPKTR
ncbi:MAG: hypothetical protein WBF90_16390 [Rivularia sp. (in: cyanobacteria)]